MQQFGNFIAVVIGLTIGLIVAVFLWMSLLVDWLGYDYVTASSIFFLLGVTGTAFNTVRSLFVARNGSRAINAFIGFLLYPIMFATTLRTYEAWVQPAMSDATNVVANYREILAVPVNAIQTAIAGIGPAFGAAVSAVEASPLLTQITAAIAVALITQVFSMAFSRLRA